MKKIILLACAFALLAAGCDKAPNYSTQLDSIAQSLNKTEKTVPNKNIDDAMTGYQAVFLTIGQTYFGKYSSYGKDYSKLTDIYYLQVGGSGLQTSSPSSFNSINLTKLGSELHGPEDTMYLPLGSILFVENLKPDSQVVKAIISNKTSK